MSWRNIVISGPARLSLERNHLVVKQEEEVHIPLEDICSIVIETPQALITSRLLDELARKSIALFSCDPMHLPSGLFIPFAQHSRQLKVLNSEKMAKEFLFFCFFSHYFQQTSFKLPFFKSLHES